MSQKSHENAKITLRCKCYFTVKTVESSLINKFLLSHPIKFDMKIHAMGKIFIIETKFVFPTLGNEKFFQNMQISQFFPNAMI